MLIRLKGARIHDPVNQLNGTCGDIWIRDARICEAPDNMAEADRTIDLEGKILMAGAIDIHSHIAGGNVNNARLLLPEQHLAERARLPQFPFSGAKWSACDTGYRYAEMGFTTVVEPAVLPINAHQAHAELADIPIIDTAGLAIVGNDDFLLRMLRDGAEQARINDYIAWTLHATRCLGVKVINAGGATAFKFNQRQLNLDDEVPMYGMTSRAILSAVQRAVVQLGIPHPVHVHCNNLGIPGNVNTALDTIKAADGLPMHLAHVQFYGYGDNGDSGFSSGASALADAIMANPNITVDIGQVLFGQTVTISGDVMRQFDARHIANPKKWVVWEGEDGGGGIVPFRYRPKNYVNALQWAIGLELFMLIDDPWRVFFTTDHPNGAPFTAYPELFRLLMDRDYRNQWLDRINAKSADISLLRHLEREYDLNDIAIMTRAAPARLLGLGDRGHLSVGAIADIAVYQPQADKAAMFGKAELVFKNGIAVVEKGQVIRSIQGKTHAVAPGFDRGIESSISDYFDRYHLMKMDHYKLDPQHLLETLGSELVLH
ncbi:formylmethanofuran dehydrogenase subunit A [Sedimenticola selenatireducens]|uniref:formylmethanofuran dehydrogenase subunit A n=1 Tax=Sedimenticola selenatireducens TaxID=191960 RepID=UPI002AABBD0B|nr:formylmethanofuran dehydrogenase subunit A [Sedimenticola selenatireducens]